MLFIGIHSSDNAAGCSSVGSEAEALDSIIVIRRTTLTRGERWDKA